MAGSGKAWIGLVAAVAVGVLASAVGAQSAKVAVPKGAAAHGWSPNASHVVIPQSRAFAVDRTASAITITAIDADVQIVEQVAVTTLDVHLANAGARQLEAEVLLPVPEGAIVRGLDFEGAAKEPTAKLLPKAEARATYDGIVSSLRDPALLEFAGYNLIRSSVFPVPARGKQRVRVIYEQVLSADGARVDYYLPRSESLQSRTVPWKISVRMKARRPISTVYSPSHQVELKRNSPENVTARVVEASQTEPGPFRISYLTEGGPLSASLFAYPDAKTGGGYFLLLAGLPGNAAKQSEAAVKREVILVIDTSGSMAGEKIEQVRAAALQIVEGLAKGEAFNIIDYSNSVNVFAEKPVIKTDETGEQARHYIRRLGVSGGTNIHDALVEALRQKPTAGMLPIVLFLTDGLPTVGVTAESQIRAAAEKANVHGRRIFTFGVGYDVNAPLLSALARTGRGTGTFVLPKENVEDKISQVYRRLSGPVLAAPVLKIVDAAGNVDTRAVRDLQPAKLVDLFEGDQIVVLGRYTREGPLSFQVSGDYLGKPATFQFKFDLTGATTRNSFVPRLWASRRIAELVEEIRMAGADAVQPGAAATMPTNPRHKELVDEIVRLSTEFGVLTEYTAFLALEGTDLSGKENLVAQANQRLYERAIGTRSGVGSINQSINNDAQVAQSRLNPTNCYWNASMQKVEFNTVQQVCDRALYKRNGQWVDGNVLAKGKTITPDVTVEFDTPEFHKLVDKLTAEGRQGLLALCSDTVLAVDGKTVLVKVPAK